MKTCLAILLALGLLPGLALAQSDYGNDGDDYRIAYAQVLRSDPVYEYVRTTVPEERCDEGVARDGGDPTGGTVVGAIVGGALGNQVGKGDGRKAATVAGAVIGGAIGRSVDKNNDSAEGPRCRTVEVEREERRIVGYDVEYRYQGETYRTRLSYDPGNQLRVRVTVQPDDDRDAGDR